MAKKVYVIELRDPTETYESGSIAVCGSRQKARDYIIKKKKDIKNKLSFYHKKVQLKIIPFEVE